MTKTKKIRRLLAKGLTAKEIAAKLNVPNSYVHTIKWQDKKNSKIIGAVFDATRDIRKAKEKKPKITYKIPAPDPKAKEWSKRNPWFGKDEEKTLKALKLHELLVQEGVDPKSNKYWDRIDIGMMDPNIMNRDKNKEDIVNKPPHYTAGGIDFLDYAEAKGLTENAYLFNVVKYVSRAGKKTDTDPLIDLKKAEFYLKREIANRQRA